MSVQPSGWYRRPSTKFGDTSIWLVRIWAPKSTLLQHCQYNPATTWTDASAATASWPSRCMCTRAAYLSKESRRQWPDNVFVAGDPQGQRAVSFMLARVQQSNPVRVFAVVVLGYSTLSTATTALVPPQLVLPKAETHESRQSLQGLPGDS